VGGQDELVFDGGSLVFDTSGKMISRAPSFQETILTIDLQIEEKLERDKFACCTLPLVQKTEQHHVYMIAPELSREEEIYHALVLGTRDYLRKNGFERAVRGRSGGVDSSLVAAIAVEALGKRNVTGVTMPSQYTSAGTRTDAEVLAHNLGIRFLELPIFPIFKSFTDTLSGVFKGTKPDITEENLQSRIRGTLMMSLSNKFKCLVLTTGNKSEMATGYATLYGDMAGGFAVIKDVPKLDVYKISRLVNDLAGREIIPETVLTRPPTAELRPDQKDSDSLPPYEILDPILKAYIEDDMGVEEIIALGYDTEVVHRVARLVDVSEYKRRQAPPGVKITPRAFGRDRRLPITNRYR
jgi:NAD+ synthase (glutamine-hydrolysing)